MSDQNTTLLLVEDSDDDAFFLQRALQKAAINLPLQIVTDGQRALNYLAGEGKYGDRTQFPMPSLVFLDLKLPYVHGFEVLGWIRSQPALKNLPVIVLTSSPEDRDRKQASDLAAQGYLVKPPTADMMREAIKFLSQPIPNSTSI
jgi:CheY-like chemotaxis protein